VYSSDHFSQPHTNFYDASESRHTGAFCPAPFYLGVSRLTLWIIKSTLGLTFYLCSLPHLGPRDIEKGIVVVSVTTETDPQALRPSRPLPSGITAYTAKPCPSGSVGLPPLGPWPLKVPYHHKPPLGYPNGFKPVKVADGPFPAAGGHSWGVPHQQSKICGTASLPTPTGMRGTAGLVGTGVGMPTSTGTATKSTLVPSGVSGAAYPTGSTGPNMPAYLGDAAPSNV